MILTQFNWNTVKNYIYTDFLKPIPFLCYCAHPCTASVSMKAYTFRPWTGSYSTVSISSLGGMGYWFPLLKPGLVVEIDIIFGKSIYTLLFFLWSLIPCYIFICELSICYILILCSLLFPLELVIASCWACFPLITYLYRLSNNWPALSHGFADMILSLCFKPRAKEGRLRRKKSCLYTWYKVFQLFQLE